MKLKSYIAVDSLKHDTEVTMTLMMMMIIMMMMMMMMVQILPFQLLKISTQTQRWT